MATVVTTFVMMLRDMGTAAAVIQRAQISSALLDTVFWFNLGIGLTLAVAVAVAAPSAATAFQEPRLAGVLMVLAISFPLTSSGAVHQALLERRVAFKQLASIELSSSIVALAVAVAAAYQGLGVYSLVLNQLAAALLVTFQLWLASRWMPSLHFSRDEFRGLWRFSGNLFASHLLNFFSRNVDSMLIGRFLGASDLGIYNMAYRIMLFPIFNLAQVVARATFPVMSQLQERPDQIGALYLRSLAAITLITAPLMSGLWVLRAPFIEIALGPNWHSVADVLAWLAPVGLMQSMMTMMGVIYMATGRTYVIFRWNIVVLAITAGAILLGLRWGFVGVAACYAVANVLMFFPANWLALKQIDLTLRPLVVAVWRQILAALCMGAMLWGLRVMLGWHTRPGLELALLVPLGALIYGALAWWWLSDLLRSLASGLRRKRGAAA